MKAHQAERQLRREVTQELKVAGMVRAIQDNCDKLNRNIPLLKEGRTPLRAVRAPLADRRRLLGWWLGLYPRADSQQCGIGGEALPAHDKREHLSLCAQTHDSWYPLAEHDIHWLTQYDADELQNRYSEDPVTNLLWITAQAGAFSVENEWGQRSFRALQLICEVGLERS